MVDFGDIWEVLKVLAKAGGIAAIHAEDNDLVMHMYEKLFARRTAPASRTWPRSTTR